MPITNITDVPLSDWRGCYDDSWRGIITSESFAHPAKMARGVLYRIVERMLAEGWLKKGDICGDPFGGIGTAGIACAYHGLRCVMMELEPRFVGLAEANFRMHDANWQQLGEPRPVMLQGDSRNFAAVVRDVAGVVTSPPYIDTDIAAKRGNDSYGNDFAKTGLSPRALGQMECERYGSSPGQIGAMPAGSLDAAITSPPYCEGLGHGGEPTQGGGKAGDVVLDAMQAGYGSAEGQIGAMPAGSLDAAITSPPYAESLKGDKSGDATAGMAKRKETGGAIVWGSNADGTRAVGDYGSSPGQIGAMPVGSLDAAITSPPYADSDARKPGPALAQSCAAHNVGTSHHKQDWNPSSENIANSTGETYWSAMRVVYDQMRRAMKPHGVAAVVVKDYVKNKQRVPLVDQTVALLESVGFTVFEVTRCHLVKQHRGQHKLDGTVEVKTKSRKSFFRRLAEAKGSPRIDWECVIWARKAAQP